MYNPVFVGLVSLQFSGHLMAWYLKLYHDVKYSYFEVHFVQWFPFFI